VERVAGGFGVSSVFPPAGLSTPNSFDDSSCVLSSSIIPIASLFMLSKTVELLLLVPRVEGDIPNLLSIFVVIPNLFDGMAYLLIFADIISERDVEEAE